MPIPPKARPSKSATDVKKKDIVDMTNDEGEPLDKEDSSDTDYEEHTQRSKSVTARSKLQRRRSDLENWSKEALITKYILLQDDRAEVKKKRAEDRKDRDAEKKQRVQLQKDIRRLTDDMEKLRKECRELRLRNFEKEDMFRAALEEKKEQFAEAQEDWIAKIDESTYPALPDNILRDQFQGLLVRCKDWVRQWCMDQTSPESLLFFCKIITQCASNQRISAERIMLNKMASKDMTMLRAAGFAWLAREMMQNFFESPFLASENARHSLQRFYDGRKGNLKKAYTWRAETLRLIREDLGLSASELHNGTIRPATLERLCSPTISRILGETLTAVLREVTPEEAVNRRLELVEICHGFCLLSLELWCQKSEVEVMDNSSLFQQPFSMGSDYLQPHVSMGMDEDDHKFDGCLSHAVLVPAIRVFGDSNGNNLEQEKILSRSIVLIFDGQPSETEDGLGREILQNQSQSINDQFARSEHDTGPTFKKRKRSSEGESVRQISMGVPTISSSAQDREPSKNIAENTQSNKVPSLLVKVLHEIERGDSYQLHGKAAQEEEADDAIRVAPAPDVREAIKSEPKD